MAKFDAKRYFLAVLKAHDVEPYFSLLADIAGRNDALTRLAELNERLWQEGLVRLGSGAGTVSGRGARPKLRAVHIFTGLQKQMRFLNGGLFAFFDSPRLDTVDSWEKVFTVAEGALPKNVRRGWFVKENVARAFLEKYPPRQIMKFLRYDSVGAMLVKENIFEIMAALRFGETKEWMHEFFSQYGTLTPQDFEQRDIQALVFDPKKWGALDTALAHDKFHKLSHLKEFGVIFIVPDLRTPDPLVLLSKSVGLLVHYFHEIYFYSEFFQHAARASTQDFADTVIALLKGEIQASTLPPEKLRIIHQYHLKNPRHDPLAFAPHVHPEALHWQQAVEYLCRWARSGAQSGGRAGDGTAAVGVDFSWWRRSDAVMMRVGRTLLSMNFADVAMDAKGIKTYHAHESLWNEIFVAHFGARVLQQAMIKGLRDGFIDLNELGK